MQWQQSVRTTFLQTFDGRLTTLVPPWPTLESMKTTFLSLDLAVAPWSVLAENDATLASLFGKKGVPDSRIAWRQVRLLPATHDSPAAAEMPTGGSGNHSAIPNLTPRAARKPWRMSSGLAWADFFNPQSPRCWVIIPAASSVRQRGNR